MNTDNFADIIREAATSPLGILALIILLLGTLAFAFFGKSSEKSRLIVWMAAFCGALLFGFAFLRAEQRGTDPNGPVHEPKAPPAANEPIFDPDPPSPAFVDDQEERVARGSVVLSYGGDQYNCSLPITIAIGDRSVLLQSAIAQLDAVPLGTQPYRVTGTIFCPFIGSCTVDSQGSVDVAPSGTFQIFWQNTSPARCAVQLQPAY